MDKLTTLGLKKSLGRKFINQCSSREISSLLRKISPEISKISPAGIKIPKRFKFCLEKGSFQPVEKSKKINKIVEIYRISKEKKDQKMRNCQQLSSFIVSSSKSVILFHIHALQNALDPMKFQVSQLRKFLKIDSFSRFFFLPSPPTFFCLFQCQYVDTDSCVSGCSSNDLDDLVWEPTRKLWITKWKPLVMEQKNSAHSQNGKQKLEGRYTSSLVGPFFFFLFSFFTPLS